MTNEQLLDLIDREASAMGRVSIDTCEAAKNLPEDVRHAYNTTMIFLGCDVSRGAESSNSPAPPANLRVRAARTSLLALGLDGPEPKWSSAVLERLVRLMSTATSTSLGDLFCALYGIFSRQTDITSTVREFINGLVRTAFTSFRNQYLQIDFNKYLADASVAPLTPTQSYLLLISLPEKLLTPNIMIAILRGLADSNALDEAVRILDANLASVAAQRLLNEWALESPHTFQNPLLRQLIAK